MFEKVNPSHPDKVADRIAGAIVDLAYTMEQNPRVAVEVLLGHGVCHIITESSVDFSDDTIEATVRRIAGKVDVDFMCVKQDPILSGNQNGKIRCGDNGIFRGVPVTDEQKVLSYIVRDLYRHCQYDGKYIINNGKITACQSNVKTKELRERMIESFMPFEEDLIVNPLGDWTGGPDVDSGATNRKLGSDMGDSITGGGLHGKDLSKADVSLNICAWIDAQLTKKAVELTCSIGDETVNGIPYISYVNRAREFVAKRGGFEKFAEWGLI